LLSLSCSHDFSFTLCCELQENPDATFGELGKLLGAAWKEVSEGDRKPYNDQAKADKERYAAELKDWLAAGNTLPEKKKRAAPKKKGGKKVHCLLALRHALVSTLSSQAKKEESDGEEEAGSGDDD
jgi:hypothetical protein